MGYKKYLFTVYKPLPPEIIVFLLYQHYKSITNNPIEGRFYTMI